MGLRKRRVRNKINIESHTNTAKSRTTARQMIYWSGDTETKYTATGGGHFQYRLPIYY